MATKKAAKKVTKKATTKKTTKAVVVASEKEMELTETNLSSAALASLANYDASEFEGVELDITENKEIFSNDIIIPKLWLMQEMSELAKDKKRKEIESGDFIDSQSEEVLLKIDIDNPEKFMPIIPIKTFKRWQTFKHIKEGNEIKKEFVSSELIVLGKNHDYEYQFSEEGSDFSRKQVISAYVLLGEDAQKGVVKPYIVDFASTSKKAGRNLVSDIKTLNARGLPSYVGWFKLGTHEDSFNDHTFFVKDLKFGGFLPKEMMGFLKEAYTEITSMIDANVIEIDDRDLHDAAKPQSDSGNVVDAVSNNADI